MSQTKAELVNGLSVNAAADDAITVDSSGKVGIGTTSPAQIFHVKNTGAHTTCRIENDNADFLIQAGDAGADGLHFYDVDNTAYRMTIANSGNVGIGTTSPTSKLSVTSTSTAANDSEPVATFTTQGHSQIRLNGDGNQWSIMALDSSAAGNNFIIYDKNNSSERVRIDSSGDMILGSTSSLGRLTVSKAQNNTSDGTFTNPHIRLNASSTTNNTGFTGIAYSVSTLSNYGWTAGAQRIASGTTGAFVFRFHVNSATGEERLRLGSDGFVGIGVTGNVSSSTGMTCFRNLSDNRRQLMLGTTSQGARALIEFFNPNGGVGSINTTGSNTAYNTTSDYRLKENVVAISDGITRLKTLKPSRFNFIADAETTVDGFLAHEVTAVPEAITGEKDAVVTQALVDSGEKDESELGNPVYQQIDQSKLVPLLTAALQEEIAKREALETRVATLEAA